MHTAHFIRHLIRHNPCRVASAVGCLFSLAVQSLAARQWAAEAPDAAAMAGLEFEGALPCTVKGLRALVMPLTAPGTSCKGRLEQGRPSLAAHLNRPPPPGGACEQRGTAAVARPVSAACGPLFAGEEGDVFANKPAAGGGSKQPKAMGMGMDLAASGDVEEDDMFAVGGRQAAGWLAGWPDRVLSRPALDHCLSTQLRSCCLQEFNAGEDDLEELEGGDDGDGAAPTAVKATPAGRRGVSNRRPAAALGHCAGVLKG